MKIRRNFNAEFPRSGGSHAADGWVDVAFAVPRKPRLLLRRARASPRPLLSLIKKWEQVKTEIHHRIGRDKR